MNIKRLIAAIAAAFVFIFASDFLIHGVWMKGDYAATMSLWRPEAEMNARMPWMMAAQILCAVTFVMLWAKGFAERACIGCACMYGLMMGLFSQVSTIITYVVSPLPPGIAVKWFVSGLGQAVLLGLVVFFVYKPAAKNGALSSQ